MATLTFEFLLFTTKYKQFLIVFCALVTHRLRLEPAFTSTLEYHYIYTSIQHALIQFAALPALAAAIEGSRSQI